MPNTGISDYSANAEVVAILQLLHEQDKLQSTAEFKQKDETIEDLNTRQKYLEQELDENKELVKERETQIRDISTELLKVCFIFFGFEFFTYFFVDQLFKFFNL